MINNNEAENDVLLPCPFCGTKPIWYLKGNAEVIGRKRVITIKCPNCRAEQETAVLRLSTDVGCDIAIKKWNTRLYDKED